MASHDSKKKGKADGAHKTAAKSPDTKDTKDDTSPPRPFPELPARVALTDLERLLTPTDDATRALLLRNEDDASLVGWGVKADTDAILDDVPGYVGSAVTILNGLGAKWESVHLPEEIFPAVVAEARALTTQKATYDQKTGASTGQTQGRKGEIRTATKAGVALRDKAMTALRNALGKDGTDATAQQIGDAETPKNLAKGLRVVAAAIEAGLASKDRGDVAALKLWKVTAATAAELEAAAAALDGLGDRSIDTRRIEQRKLDAHDGRVLVLLDVIDRAFRQAHRVDPTILIPTFHALASLFGGRSSASAPTPPAPPAPLPPPGP